MKKNLCLLIFTAFIVSCTATNQTEPTRDFDVYDRLEELNITLPEPGSPVANYVPARTVGNLVFLSGHGPRTAEGILRTGKVGEDLTLEEGYEAARLTGLSLLASLEQEIGDLNRIKRFIKVLGMVNVDSSFTDMPKVINGFSDLMVEVFGEHGKHARSAVGMASLPANIPVEIEMIVEID
ncbi:MAG: RidA family protein [Candidatus Aminicenantes bacterium]|jgi:enamine deaminase RidA (YjgF/YER057c/UK114 family)